MSLNFDNIDVSLVSTPPRSSTTGKRLFFTNVANNMNSNNSNDDNGSLNFTPKRSRRTLSLEEAIQFSFGSIPLQQSSSSLSPLHSFSYNNQSINLDTSTQRSMRMEKFLNQWKKMNNAKPMVFASTSKKTPIKSFKTLFQSTLSSSPSSSLSASSSLSRTPFTPFTPMKKPVHNKNISFTGRKSLFGSGTSNTNNSELIMEEPSNEDKNYRDNHNNTITSPNDGTVYEIKRLLQESEVGKVHTGIIRGNKDVDNNKIYIIKESKDWKNINEPITVTALMNASCKVTPIRDWWISNKVRIVIFDFIPGDSVLNYFIKRFVNNNKISYTTFAQVAFKMVESMVDIHKQGIIHADIKGDHYILGFDNDTGISLEDSYRINKNSGVWIDFGVSVSKNPNIRLKQLDEEGDRDYLKMSTMYNDQPTFGTDLYAIALLILDLAMFSQQPQNFAEVQISNLIDEFVARGLAATSDSSLVEESKVFDRNLFM